MYAIDALCYAPELALVYGEINRVLKPGGLFAFADWTMTDKFNVDNPEHRKIRNWIEFGNGITRMPLVHDIRDALRKTGVSLPFPILP